jgi:hypothetical protein
MEIREPLVRIHCAGPEDEVRCRAALERAGLAPEKQLTWLVVRDADPDAVNEALAAGGALGRAVVREEIGKLIGFVLDHGGEVAGRAASLESTVRRVLSAAGLERRHSARTPAELVHSAAELHEYLMATGGGFVSWERFLGLFCRPVEP